MAAFAIGASILGLAVCFSSHADVLHRLCPIQLANQSGYVDIHFDRIRDTAHQQLTHVQQAARAAVPQTATTNIDGEEIETFIDQASPSVTDSVSYATTIGVFVPYSKTYALFQLKRFALTNLAITSSFVGGFLLGVAFE